MKYLKDVELTFFELAELESGTILMEDSYRGIPWIIMRGPSHLCAYLGLPPNHPFANLNYYDISLSVHGGLTFGGLGDGKIYPSEYYWLGWDYGHFQDAAFYDLEPPFSKYSIGTMWTVPMVLPEVIEAAGELADKLAAIEED